MGLGGLGGRAPRHGHPRYTAPISEIKMILQNGPTLSPRCLKVTTMGRGSSGGLPVVLLVLVLGDVAGVDQVEEGRHAHHHLQGQSFDVNDFRFNL